MSFQSFEDLLVWQRGRRLAVDVYIELRSCRDYALRDQMQRASVSIASNIAEGYERSPKDFARFLSIAIGSSSELRTQIYIASDLSIIHAEKAVRLIDETKQLNRMMRALAKKQLEKGNGKSSDAEGFRVQEELSAYQQYEPTLNPLFLNPEP